MNPTVLGIPGPIDSLITIPRILAYRHGQGPDDDIEHSKQCPRPGGADHRGSSGNSREIHGAVVNV